MYVCMYVCMYAMETRLCVLKGFRSANAHDFIIALPDLYETEVCMYVCMYIYIYIYVYMYI